MARRPDVLDGLKVNILKNWRLNPLTTSERTALGATLDSRHTGLPVVDISGGSAKLYLWTGTAWRLAEGSGGGGGGATTARVYNETPGGLNNGINLVFTTAGVYVTGTTALFVNGLRLKPGAGNDYTESGASQITFLNPIPPSANILIDYDVNL